jgi:hypothetical protein
MLTLPVFFRSAPHLLLTSFVNFFENLDRALPGVMTSSNAASILIYAQLDENSRERPRGGGGTPK